MDAGEGEQLRDNRWPLNNSPNNTEELREASHNNWNCK